MPPRRSAAASADGQSNRLETERSSLMRRIASAISGAIVSWRMLCDSAHRLGRDDAVGHHQLLDRRGGDPRHRAARQHAMRDIGIDRLGAAVDQRRGGVAQRAGAVDDVVDQDAAPPVDVADDVHDLRHAGALAPLVDDREIGVEPAGDLAGAHDAADIGRDDHEILAGMVLAGCPSPAPARR